MITSPGTECKLKIGKQDDPHTVVTAMYFELQKELNYNIGVTTERKNKCPVCKKEDKGTEDNESCLAVCFDNGDNIQEILENQMNTEFYCTTCNKDVRSEMIKKITVHSESIMIFHSQIYGQRARKITISKEITLNGKTYTLRAIVYHSPGHYYTVGIRKNQWYELNDSRASKIQSMNEELPKMLCYTLKDN